MNFAFGQQAFPSFISNSVSTVQFLAQLPDEMGGLFIWVLRKPVIKEVTQILCFGSLCVTVSVAYDLQKKDEFVRTALSIWLKFTVNLIHLSCSESVTQGKWKFFDC